MKKAGEKEEHEELILGTKSDGRLEYGQEPGWLEIGSKRWQPSYGTGPRNECVKASVEQRSRKRKRDQTVQRGSKEKSNILLRK